jgi:hypothetical protein
MRTNPLKDKLLRGENSFGLFAFEFFTPGLAQIAREAGAEFVLLDMEHSGAGIDTIKQQVAYCRGLDVVPLVRVPTYQYQFVARALDVGALGVMLPMVETAEQARDIVSWTRYPPAGRRGAACNSGQRETCACIGGGLAAQPRRDAVADAAGDRAEVVHSGGAGHRIPSVLTRRRPVGGDGTEDRLLSRRTFAGRQFGARFRAASLVQRGRLPHCAGGALAAAGLGEQEASVPVGSGSASRRGSRCVTPSSLNLHPR